MSQQQLRHLQRGLQQPEEASPLKCVSALAERVHQLEHERVEILSHSVPPVHNVACHVRFLHVAAQAPKSNWQESQPCTCKAFKSSYFVPMVWYTRVLVLQLAGWLNACSIPFVATQD